MNSASSERMYSHHPVAFVIGTVAVVAGVIAHIPMYLSSASMNYHMAGMEMSMLMNIGMFAIVIGTVIFGMSLMPGKIFGTRSQAVSDLKASDMKIQAMDDVKISPLHIKLFVCLALALVVDVMKPATLGFVVPGASEEYGLTKAQAALVPFGGILGTTMGSFLWGWLGDTIGRRAAILLAAMIFIGTSICGAMPSYNWNVFMCWAMGLGAGGMLPTTFALLSEITPKRQRGWLVVLLGGIGTIGGYLAASGFAALLEPEYGWRIMWFLGLPTGVLLIFLNRYIPESPRFLIANNRDEEAEEIMKSFGVQIVKSDSTESNPSQGNNEAKTTVKSGSLLELFSNRRIALTSSLGLFGFSWGLVNFGFLLWLPTHLREFGMSVGASDEILAQSALIAFPSTVLAAWLYYRWSSKYSLVLFAMMTSACLLGFAFMGESLVLQPLVMGILLAMLLVSCSGSIAMLSPYTAEVYPVHIRSTGSGWSAGCSKGAGVLALGFSASVGIVPGMTTLAVLAAVPTAFAALAIYYAGVETKGLSLEAVSSQ